MDLNRATIIGRLTRDPELKTTTTGKNVATMSVAAGRTWTDQSGTRQEQTEFLNCVLWGKLAEIAGQYLTKGHQVYVEGRIQTRDWTGDDGVKRYRTEIVVQNLIMLGGGNKNAGRSKPNVDMGGEPPPEAHNEEEIRVEDIPF